MIEALCLILGCELVGEALRRLMHLPAPGPVIGMIVLAVGLIAWPRRSSKSAAEPPIPRDLERVADALLKNMGLLFVPAGVGVVAEAALIRGEWLPILAGVLGSTLIGLLVTAQVMHWCLPDPESSLNGPDVV